MLFTNAILTSEYELSILDPDHKPEEQQKKSEQVTRLIMKFVQFSSLIFPLVTNFT